MEQGCEFWRFSLSLYGCEGVPAACVALQDAHGLDVNLMLFALWLASRGRRISPADIAAAEAAVGDWRREAVVPLRGVRRFLKEAPAAIDPAGAAALRARVKAAELEAERLQQEALFALRAAGNWGAPEPDLHAAARANIDACAEALGAAFTVAPTAAILQSFTELVAPAP